MAGRSVLDIEQEISEEGLLRAENLAAVPALLEKINIRPKSKSCFASFVASYGDTEVDSIQVEFTENEEHPRLLDKLAAIFPDAPEGAHYSFARKMRSFVFKPNRFYSDWLSAQELDLKVRKFFTWDV